MRFTAVACVGEQGAECTTGFCHDPSGVREVRRLGQNRALDLRAVADPNRQAPRAHARPRPVCLQSGLQAT